MAATKKRFSWTDVPALYYITHKANLPSILAHGILSHAEMVRQNIQPHKIYNEHVVTRRQDKKINEQSLWEYANLYFQPRNPMLFQVLRHGQEARDEEIIVLSINPMVLNLPGAIVTTGNAAADATEFFPIADGEKHVGALQQTFMQEYWNATDGSKRKIMAEYIVPQTIPASFIQSIYVAKTKIKEEIEKLCSSIPVIVEPYMFFRPRRSIRLTEKLSLADGDMFFSTHQTLTVSVNTVGIMGKGLASRAKYQFPDVYVKYQDLCRKKQLLLGKPALYKRDFEIVTHDYPDIVDGKWFLLFPTKDHWRNNSRIRPIEDGLQWLVDNYTKLGIESLAIPALGCGLGNLGWDEVGPLMCNYLSKLNITCSIYLPQGKEIPQEQISLDYLLAQ